jgi:antitoxin component YwqK of YwqJK toxin-antitoxin module
MRLKEKSNWISPAQALLGVLIASMMYACNNSGKELSEAEIRLRDSVSKEEQRRYADSLKKTNPLLIVPPDSTYTGTYIDKYPNGVVKFTGFFRFGERHGQWMSFFPNGELWSEMHYDKGLRHGPNIVYYDNNKMRYQGNYKNDHQDSIWLYFEESGQLAKTVLFRNGTILKELPLE